MRHKIFVATDQMVYIIHIIMKLIRNEEKISLENFTKNVKTQIKCEAVCAMITMLKTFKCIQNRLYEHCVCTSDFTVFLIKRKKNSSLPA